MSDLTQVFAAIQRGETRAGDELLSLVYEELRRIAAFKMAREAPGHTLQPTALVHEAWLRLTGSGEARFGGRAHFFTAAAEAMRRVLVDSARRKRSLKRGGEAERTELQDSHLVLQAPSDEVLAVDEALARLTAEDALAAELVKLRYFAGLSMAEAADALGLPLRTAERLWCFARAWLRRRIEADRA